MALRTQTERSIHSSLDYICCRGIVADIIQAMSFVVISNPSLFYSQGFLIFKEYCNQLSEAPVSQLEFYEKASW